MVDVQDSDAHPHKRTAIPQLLNPVSSSPTKRQEEHAYATYRNPLQHPSPSTAARSDPARPDLSPASRQAFHLRAAQWEPTNSSPPNAVQYPSASETNGIRSAGYPTHDSGPRSSDGSGYAVTTSHFCHPQNIINPPAPVSHVLLSPPHFPLIDGRTGKLQKTFESNFYSLTV